MKTHLALTEKQDIEYECTIGGEDALLRLNHITLSNLYLTDSFRVGELWSIKTLFCLSAVSVEIDR